MILACCLILVLGSAAQWLAWKVRMPSILLLLATGLLVGPIAREFSPAIFHRPIALNFNSLVSQQTLVDLVSLAVGIILFEGGLTLNFREIAGVRRVVAMLVSVGALITWALASLFAYAILKLTPQLSILLGAVLIVTGPTVIGPLLRFVRPTGKAGSVVRWEGIVIDPIGAMITVLVFEVVASGITIGSKTAALSTVIAMFQGAMLTISCGTLIGLAAAFLLTFAISRFAIPDHLHVPATVALVVAAFAGSNLLVEESGLFTTTVMGMAMANQSRARIRHIMEFKEIVTTILIASLFIVLSSRIEFSSLRAMGWQIFPFVAALILIVRPLSVLISTMGSALTTRERLFIGWMAPRGIVAASVASVFALKLQEHGNAEAKLLLPYTFAVVALTVIVYGLSASVVAKKLGLSRGGQSGFLIVGGGTFGREIAQLLIGEKVDVLLVDTNLDNIRQARLSGIPVVAANALSTTVMERIALSPIGRLLALTPNHEVNALTAVQYARIFGRENIFQLPATRDVDDELVGRNLFDPNATAQRIEDRIEDGAKLSKTRITAEFDFQKFKEMHGSDAMPMMVITDAGVQMITTDAPPPIAPGVQIVSLTMGKTSA